ncbi:phosphoribosylamine--glycine ligase [Weissella hellenica]|uniref:Phosphoribosylamine--glycine ligase n=1 Tax=Weissella hellenica TaxID=46256 RepID=A0A4Y4G1P5_WEIHE|nr:phosphoribosylamine--glycine ligase [Weissella hellenica]NKY67230.1 phosphoribosylamine--glycine ligase [Weissella hellenica]GED36159.1 phosphoribosylamine--glycine ligase [Weissella hellenica]SCC00371.1 phosphoribosylamine--glycine ligase [Weissella hellenica]
MFNVLVIGSGAREHAIATTFLHSQQVQTVFCAPGNPGMQISGIETVAISENDFEKLAIFAVQQQIDLVFVGPEAPLANGIVDFLSAKGIQVFGPNQAAARLESDKQFAKEFMKRNHVPTADFNVFTDVAQALDYSQQLSLPVVIKENGLAGGKGVQIVKDTDELSSALHDGIQKSHQVLVEDYLVGEEFSLMVFVGGPEPIILPISQDHKRIFEGDQGPNTGGMGAYSPVPHITDDIIAQVKKTIVAPIMTGLQNEHLMYAGTLYIGCMLTSGGIKVIEFNVRLGDPETQILLPQLKSDFYTAITDLIAGKSPQMIWQNKDYYLGTVVAAPGYPSDPQQHIALPDLPDNVFYGGVVAENQKLYSSGGRIFTLIAHAPTLKDAQLIVNTSLANLNLANFYYRKDIGFHDLD